MDYHQCLYDEKKNQPKTLAKKFIYHVVVYSKMLMLVVIYAHKNSFQITPKNFLDDTYIRLSFFLGYRCVENNGVFLKKLSQVYFLLFMFSTASI